MRKRPLTLIALSAGALGVALGFFALPQQYGDSLSSLPSLQSVSVSARSYEGEQQPAVSATLSDEESVLSPRSGRITSLDCHEGKTWKSGESYFAIDGDPVIALHADAPFWRDMTIGTRGSDVAGLQQALSDLGYSVQNTDVYDQQTHNALAELVSEQGGKAEREFNVENFVWLSGEETVVADCVAHLGQDVTADSEIISGGGALVSLDVDEIEKDSPPRVLIAGDEVLALGDSTTVTDSDFLQAFSDSRLFAQWEDDPSTPLTVKSKYSEPIEVLAIPPAAIISTQGTSDACVATSSGGVWVTLIASELGQTLVRGDLPDTVLTGDIKDISCT